MDSTLIKFMVLKITVKEELNEILQKYSNQII